MTEIVQALSTPGTRLLAEAISYSACRARSSTLWDILTPDVHDVVVVALGDRHTLCTWSPIGLFPTAINQPVAQHTIDEIVYTAWAGQHAYRDGFPPVNRGDLFPLPVDDLAVVVGWAYRAGLVVTSPHAHELIERWDLQYPTRERLAVLADRLANLRYSPTGDTYPAAEIHMHNGVYLDVPGGILLRIAQVVREGETLWWALVAECPAVRNFPTAVLVAESEEAVVEALEDAQRGLVVAVPWVWDSDSLVVGDYSNTAVWRGGVMAWRLVEVGRALKDPASIARWYRANPRRADLEWAILGGWP
jgi:hypothetical protein